jgi:hypothetical protein
MKDEREKGRMGRNRKTDRRKEAEGREEGVDDKRIEKGG